MKLKRTVSLLAGTLAATAWVVASSVRSTEHRHPPKGRFVEVDGTAVHYFERGEGRSIILLHGNGVIAEDWLVSGIFAELAARYHVVAFDRPGFGYSERPRGRPWGPQEQAEFLHATAVALEIERPMIVAHSWATMVAASLALARPADVAGLVLLSGYYFPTARLDTLLLGLPAIPLVGDLFSSTLAPIAGRLLAPLLVRALFAPAPVDDRFAAEFPLSMSLRPSQLRACAQDSLGMVQAATALSKRYAALTLPVAVLAGDGDRVADPQQQSNRLARQLAGADAELIAGAGHMIHYFAPDRIIAAVDTLANRIEQPSPSM